MNVIRKCNNKQQIYNLTQQYLLRRSMEPKKILIIQTSPAHTASTLLVNAIYGLIPELFNKRIIYNSLQQLDNTIYDKINSNFKNIIAIKTHNLNIDELINVFGNKYRLLFVSSERQQFSYMIDQKYKKYGNVVVFDFDELNETSDNTLVKIVDNMYDKLKPLLIDVALNKTTCMERIKLMNVRYEEIKNKEFTFIDDFFEIHGSHRNREKLK
jgi:hypothetical protein